MSQHVRYERVPQLDKRIKNGDDFAGDAYVRWVAVGHSPNDPAYDAPAETAPQPESAAKSQMCSICARPLRSDCGDPLCPIIAQHSSEKHSEGPTPRTDEAMSKCATRSSISQMYGYMTEFAKELERELAYAISRSEEELAADRAMTRGVVLAEAAQSAIAPHSVDFEQWLSYQPFLEDHGPLPITRDKMYLTDTVRAAWKAALDGGAKREGQ